MSEQHIIGLKEVRAMEREGWSVCANAEGKANGLELGNCYASWFARGEERKLVYLSKDESRWEEPDPGPSAQLEIKL